MRSLHCLLPCCKRWSRRTRLGRQTPSWTPPPTARACPSKWGATDERAPATT